MSNSIPSAPAVPPSVPREPSRITPSIQRAQESSPRADARSQLNASIVKSSLEVSIRSGNEPLALLYRTAIDRLNEVLAPEFGENAIQNAASQDNSAEGTAARIVALSTGFFEAYKAQHPDEDPAAQLEKFMDLIRGGFEQGYADASGILQGLGVLEGDIASGIERTHELVLKGYADFAAAQGSSSQT